MRKHVYAWRGAERIWLRRRGLAYPQGVGNVLKYIAAPAEGERRTQISDFMITLTFIERACGTPAASCLSGWPEEHAAAEEAKLRGTSSRTWRSSWWMRA